MRDGFLAYLKEDAKRGKDDGKNDLANIAERKLASGAERHFFKSGAMGLDSEVCLTSQ
jgi:hypothetical protein